MLHSKLNIEEYTTIFAVSDSLKSTRMLCVHRHQHIYEHGSLYNSFVFVRYS